MGVWPRRGLCAFEELAHNGLASAQPAGEFLARLGPCLRGLCAFEELAHNGLAPARPAGEFLARLGPCLRGLCAIESQLAKPRDGRLLTRAARNE